jgi:sugar (pentulose or hexulose) kinase
MNKVSVIAVFDIGKTNKKLLVFDEQYRVVQEMNTRLEEIRDEDDFPCEDIQALSAWVTQSFQSLLNDERFQVKAVNFSGYGASFVLLDAAGKPTAPLYNYLKPYSPALLEQFYNSYGGESAVAKQTASPVLGNLNSGMQLYRLKYEQPALFSRIKYALHLPQYLSYLLCGAFVSDITSIGCHTNLWHFQQQHYHDWVQREGIDALLAPLAGGQDIVGHTEQGIPAGAGLHDSSAALIPYLASFSEPFVLLSTGTWCISLNPFNHSRLTDYELHQDCLCYLTYKGQPVKASRLFAGQEHEQQVKRLAEHFGTAGDYYKTVEADTILLNRFKPSLDFTQQVQETAMIGQSRFAERPLSSFENYETAYHQLIADIVEQQIRSTSIVLKGTPVTRLFVDGGFSQNPVYMFLLAAAFPALEVYAATVAQASALGAALALHQNWNKAPLPAGIIGLKMYSGVKSLG